MGHSFQFVLVVLACCFCLSVGFSTSGNKILDAAGNQVLLRGVARPSLEWNSAGEHLALSDYQLMKNWGANVVRLSLSQCFWKDVSGYPGTIDQQVAWIKSLGMACIIDLHWSVGSGSTCGQQTMPDSASTTFWTSVATRYKNDAAILFELYNEPHDVAWSIWKNGGDAGGFTTPGFQSLYNTVRATGANNVVIIGGLNYAYDLSGVPSNLITGTNIAYCTHPYDYSGKQAQDWDTGIPPALRNAYPIVATEFGEFNCNPAYINTWIAWANTNCISWTAWAWYQNGCGFPSLINDWSGTPSADGQAVKTSLLSNFKCGSTASSTATTSATVTSTTTTTTTTTTTGSTATRETIYDNSLQNGWQDWSWASPRSLTNTNPVNSAPNSISATLAAYVGVYFNRGTNFQLGSWKNLVCSIHGGTIAGLPITVGLKDANKNDIGNKVSIPTAVKAGAWVVETIPVSSFGVSTTTQLSGVVYQYNADNAAYNGKTIYFDDIYFL